MAPSWEWVFLDECASTNDYARGLGDWHVVCAKTQTAGRGRHGRTWVSNDGGLWLSAVVPARLSDVRWKLLPLAAGYAVASTVRELGVSSVRLRWPNDVMVGPRKCAGILVERFHPDRCVVGIGVNLTNHPDHGDPSLQGQAVSLQELVAVCPSRETLMASLLEALRGAVEQIHHEGPEAFTHRLSAFWGPSRSVCVVSGTVSRPGQFLGVDAQGRIRFQPEEGPLEMLEADHIQFLRETGEAYV